MKPYKIAFYVNPVSGGGQGRVLMGFLSEIMQSFNYQDSEWKAEYSEIHQSEEQIDRLLSLSEKLIAVGGDGTMSAVLTRAVLQKGRQGVELGLIPLGTGNDLARMMNIYHHFINKGLVSTVRKLIQSPSKNFDLWSVNDKYTLSAYLSIGLDAKIAHHFDQDRRAGKIKYKAAWYNKLYYMKMFWKYRNWRLLSGTSISFKDNTEKYHEFDMSRRRSLVIGNINSYAGGSNPFGHNDFADGLLEVVPLKSFKRWAAAILTNTSRFSAWVFSRYISPSFHAHQIELNVPLGEYIQIDGEDMTEKLSGKTLKITHTGQVNLLVFQE